MAKKSTKSKGTVVPLMMSRDVAEPRPGDYVLSQGTPPTIHVSSSGWGTERVFARLHSTTETITIPNDPTAPGSGFTMLTASGASRAGDVEVPNTLPCAFTTPSSNNIALTMVYDAGASTTVNFFRKISFKYVCAKFVVTVGAWACPWFAFRQDDVGPEGEDIITHRPVRVRFPSNAASATLTASGWWRNEWITAAGDTGGSGPAGRGTPHILYKEDYQLESAVDSDRPLIDYPDTEEHKLKTCTLVGVLEYVDPNTASRIVELGASHVFTAAELPDDVKAVHLGMWDGRQWTKASSPFGISNSGEVTVVFDWAP